MTTLAEQDARGIDDVEPCEHETRDRIMTGTVTVLPVFCLLIVGWQVWGQWLGWNDIFVFTIMYVLTGLGVTVGFHRMLTHRAFKTTPLVRGIFTVLGSAAIEGPAISWVADHRKHHAFSDRPGDPHSPHVDHGSGLRGALRGLTHAHVGWLFLHTHRGRRTRYAPDLLGWLFGGTLRDGFTGLLWGGAVRVLVLHHATFSINSLCHFFGRRRFGTKDESRNLLWLSLFTFGESWHNNHHAFPTSAAHGMRRWELDPSAYVIAALEKLGLAWDVVRIPPERQATKLAEVA